MGERVVSANGVELCTEAFGDPADPALLLVMGATASMLRWEDELCAQLAAGGRYVLRYDNRDTGRSTSYDPGHVPYTVEDLADDAAGVLDAYGIAAAHVMGASMGGMIAQHVALRHPQRVLSLTAIMSTPDPSSIFAPDGGPDALPGPSPDLLAALVAVGAIDWDDEEAVIAAHTRFAAVLEVAFHDPVATDDILRRERRRARNSQSAQNHVVAVGSTPRWRDRLGEITAPTLVIHGTLDPILPFAHGEALAKEIPGATLLAMEGAGHDIPRPLWPVVVPAIIAHTAGR